MIIMIRKTVLRAAGVLAAAVVLGAGVFTAAGRAAGKESQYGGRRQPGTQFSGGGEPPVVANATMDYLKKFDAYYAEDTDKKELFLTFDAGYENGHTAKILDTFKKSITSRRRFFCGGKFHRDQS